MSMSDNGTQLVITTEAITYIVTLASDTLTAVTDSDFPNADTVAFLGGYFFFNNNQPGSSGQLFWSEIYEGTTYDALDFATAENAPDNLVAVWRDHDRLLLFGDDTIESWFLTGGAEIVAPYKGSVINRGLGARWSIANLDNSVFFLDDSGIVRRIGGQGGYNAERVSTHAIENDIATAAWRHDDDAAYDGAVASSYIEEGHEFYVLTIPGHSTWVFDAATGVWHKRKSKGLEASRFSFHINAYNMVLCGDTETGKLYEQSLEYVSENGEEIIAEVQLPPVTNLGDRFRVHELQVHIQNPGVNIIDVPTYLAAADSDWTQRDNQFGSSAIAKIVYGYGQTWLAVAADGKVSVSTNATLSWSSVDTGLSSSYIHSFALYHEAESAWLITTAGAIGTGLGRV